MIGFPKKKAKVRPLVTCRSLYKRRIYMDLSMKQIESSEAPHLGQSNKLYT